MKIDLIIAMPIICSIVAVILSIKGYFKKNDKDLEEDVKDKVIRETTIATKLDILINGNNDIKREIKEIKQTTDDLKERLILVEQSSKSAHKRLDEVYNESKGGKK